MLRGVDSFLVIVVSGHRPNLQGQNSPRRMPGTGRCMSKIITYYSLHEYYSRYRNTAKGRYLCATLQQWLLAVCQHCVLCSVATTSRRSVVWTVSAFPWGCQLDARGITVRSQPVVRDFLLQNVQTRTGVAAAWNSHVTSIVCWGLDCVEIHSTHSYALMFWRVIKHKEKHENLRSR